MSPNIEQARELRKRTKKALMDCVHALDIRGQDLDCAEEYLCNRDLKRPEFPKWDKLKRKINEGK